MKMLLPKSNTIMVMAYRATIRDVILLKPKLVICLSRFYNFANKLGFVKEKQYAEILKTYPFTNPGRMTNTELEEYAGVFQEQYRQAANTVRDRNYIADISELFDSDSEVYLDACHVRDCYTSKIAEAICKHAGMEVGDNEA